MNSYFSFDSQQFDFWPVYDTIKQYYPIGLSTGKAEADDIMRQTYPGQELMWQLIADNIINTKNYRSRWSTFQKELQSVLKKRVHADNSLSTPCFNGYIPLKKEQGSSIIYTKELRFCISFLGPYYTIYGLDQSFIQLPESFSFQLLDGTRIDSATRHAVHAVTVSPYQEYAELFTALEQQLQLRFPGYRLLPFKLSLQLLKGLPHEDSRLYRDQAVFEALFHSHYPLANLPPTAFRGDAYYGMDAWRRPPQD